MYPCAKRCSPGTGPNKIMISERQMLSTLTVCCVALVSNVAFAHVVPDGHIERAVQVVVRDRSIEIEIRVGINEKTQLQIIKKLTDKNVDPEQLNELFQNWISQQVVERTNVVIGTSQINPTLVKVVPNARRHVDYAIFLTATIPPGIEEIDLTVENNAMTAFPGNWRGAIKTKGDAMIGRTDDAPILIRAESINLTELEEYKRKAVEKISAKLLIPITP